jgi:hypothetical protein
LPLTTLAAWLADQDPSTEPVALTDDEKEIVFTGAIDRVDVKRAAGSRHYAVIDYKTGKMPTGPDVKRRDEMQVLLYALAIETGVLPLPDISAEAGGTEDPPRVVSAFYYPLSATRIGLSGKPHFDDDRELLGQAATDLLEMARRAASDKGPFPLVPGAREGKLKGDLPCKHCDFRGICRLEERPGLPPALQVKIDKMVGEAQGGGA